MVYPLSVKPNLSNHSAENVTPIASLSYDPNNKRHQNWHFSSISPNGYLWKKNVPWTDGKGNRDSCEKAVGRWCALHDALSDSKSKKWKETSRRCYPLSNYWSCKGLRISNRIIGSSKGWWWRQNCVRFPFQRSNERCVRCLHLVSFLHQNWTTWV